MILLALATQRGDNEFFKLIHWSFSLIDCHNRCHIKIQPRIENLDTGNVRKCLRHDPITYLFNSSKTSVRLTFNAAFQTG